MLSAIWPYRKLGNEFMPPLDEGTLMFMPVTSNAISLTEAVEIMKIGPRHQAAQARALKRLRVT